MTHNRSKEHYNATKKKGKKLNQVKDDDGKEDILLNSEKRSRRW
jgi:hypothetical protein